MRCEDYPCCGHTDQDPCGPQYYDAPGYYDTSRPGNEHALCDHENGECDVWEEEPDDSDDEYAQSLENDSIDGDWYHMNEDAAMEFGLFGSET